MEAERGRTAIMKKTKWWQYVLAVIVFALVFFVVPIVVYLADRLINLLSPRYLQDNDYWWSWVLGYGFAAYISSNIALAACSANYKFSGVLSLVGAVYSIFVATWNFAVGVNSFDVTVGILAGGIVCIVMGVKFFRTESGENREEKQQQS